MGGIASLISFVGTAVVRLFADKVIGWIALKTVLAALFIVIFPIVLNNFLHDLIQIMYNFINTQSSSGFNGAVTLSGFLAWLVDLFQIPAFLSVIIAAYCLRITLKMIPFVRL